MDFISKILGKFHKEVVQRKDITPPISVILYLMETDPGRFDCTRKHYSEEFCYYTIRDRENGAVLKPGRYGCVIYTYDEVKALEKAALKIMLARSEAWVAARKKAQRDWLSKKYN